MTKRNFNKNDIVDLLIKKASGFYYTEEQLEYEKSQNKSNLIKNKTIIEDISNNFSFSSHQLSFLNDKQKPPDKNNETAENNENLTLVKKKITTHYISPDMVAIKTLLEIFGQEVNKNNLDSLTDAELINLKNKLIGELLNEETINNPHDKMWHCFVQPKRIY